MKPTPFGMFCGGVAAIAAIHFIATYPLTAVLVVIFVIILSEVNS